MEYWNIGSFDIQAGDTYYDLIKKGGSITMQIKKILVAVDGSDHSMRAAEYAADLSSIARGEILLLYCRKPFSVVLGEPNLQNLVQKMQKKSNKLLDPYRALFKQKKIPFSDRILEGHADDVIVEVAKTEKSDLIVMGSRGRGTLEGLLLGSNTHRVLKTAPCPVLVVR
jgi:nucleotide-binding universal stress UspA family protein